VVIGTANVAHFHDRQQHFHDRFTDGHYRLAQSDAPLNTLQPELTMKKEQEIVRIELTPEQKQQVQKETGKLVDAFEFTVHELEERIAPRNLLNL
jgi:hypothetical protein